MRKYRLSVIIRIFVILLLGYVGIYVALKTYFWMISIWILLFEIFLIFNLLKHIEKPRAELIHFLDSIKQNDFSYSYSDKEQLNKKGKENQDIKYAFNEIMKVFHKLRKEQAEHYAYLQTVVEHVKVALLCFDENYRVQLINNEAKELFQSKNIYSAESLIKIDNQLYEIIKKQQSGDKEIVKVLINNKLLNLSIRTSEFILGKKKYKLVSFQDIKSELDVQELESWQKLIRVITHEIRNSAIPISTLSRNLTHNFVGENLSNFQSMQNDDLNDLKLGLETIANRSQGLVKFVESTGKFTQPLKTIEFQEINIKDLFIKISTLLQEKFKKEKIDISYKLVPKTKDFVIKADKELIEQTIINLVLNSIEALEEQDQPKIELLAFKTLEGKTEIRVTDNGKGISEDLADKIFIPFYSTKEKGNGIGLSLAKQIMHQHKGSIHFKSVPYKETSFSLVF